MFVIINIKCVLGNNRGIAMVMVSASMVALMIFGAIVVDMGGVYVDKSRLSAAMDAAALAGAQGLAVGRDQAINKATEYALKNGVDSSKLIVTVSQDGKSINVQSEKDTDLYFAKVINKDKLKVKAQAEAALASITGISGARPFAVEKQQFQYGLQVVLKDGAGSGYDGNYGGIALGGTGANTYKYNIIYGYDGVLRVGDYVPTEPGNMVGPTKTGINTLINECNHVPKCTFDNYQPDCPLIIFIPVVDSLQVSGRTDVKIIGFAAFFLEGVSGSGGYTDITGRFIKYEASGEVSTDQSDYGLTGVKLVK